MTDPARQPAHPAHARERAGQPRFGVVGTATALLGAGALIASFTVTDWYRHDAGDQPSHFSDMRAALDQVAAYHAANPIASAYFAWLAWLLLVVAVIAAVLGNVPGSGASLLRGCAVLVALAGIVLTFLAIDITSGTAHDTPDYYGYLKQARLGFYLALAGFALTGAGALIRPGRSG